MTQPSETPIPEQLDWAKAVIEQDAEGDVIGTAAKIVLNALRAQPKAAPTGWIVTSEKGTVLHFSKYDGWTVEEGIMESDGAPPVVGRPPLPGIVPASAAPWKPEDDQNMPSKILSAVPDSGMPEEPRSLTMQECGDIHAVHRHADRWRCYALSLREKRQEIVTGVEA